MALIPVTVRGVMSPHILWPLENSALHQWESAGLGYRMAWVALWRPGGGGRVEGGCRSLGSKEREMDALHSGGSLEKLRLSPIGTRSTAWCWESWTLVCNSGTGPSLASASVRGQNLQFALPSATKYQNTEFDAISGISELACDQWYHYI